MDVLCMNCTYTIIKYFYIIGIYLKKLHFKYTYS